MISQNDKKIKIILIAIIVILLILISAEVVYIIKKSKTVNTAKGRLEQNRQVQYQTILK